MDSTRYFDFSPIYALATPYGKSAIAVFRTSGEGTFDLINKIFSSKLKREDIKCPQIKYGYIRDNNTGEAVDEVVLSVFPKGHGYTKEEAVEINTHGSLAVIKKLSKLLENVGFRQAEGGEFSYRAYKTGTLTLPEAEAVLDIIESTSEKATSYALKTRMGFLDKRIEDVYKDIVNLSSLFELQLDYSEDEFDEDISFPEHEVDKIKRELKNLVNTYKVSNIIKGGINVILVGATNAGKSTIFNTLLKSNRSIVSDEKGTTRDYIKESIEINGVCINLYDTAGINSQARGVEKIGVSRTMELMNLADVIIHVIPLDDLINEKIDSIESFIPYNLANPDVPTITVLSKADLTEEPYPVNITPLVESGAILYSSITKEGIGRIVDTLIKLFYEKINPSSGEVNDLLIGSTVYNAIKKAYSSIESILPSSPIEAITIAIKDALFSLGEVLGKENPSDEVLGALFGRFCVGK